MLRRARPELVDFEILFPLEEFERGLFDDETLVAWMGRCGVRTLCAAWGASLFFFFLFRSDELV